MYDGMLADACDTRPLHALDVFEVLTHLTETGWLHASLEGYQDDGEYGTGAYSLFSSGLRFRALRTFLFSGDGDKGDIVRDLAQTERRIFAEDLEVCESQSSR